MSKATRALVIPVGEPPRVADLTFEQLQEAVGGDVQVTQLPDEQWREELGFKAQIVGFTNEEGKYIGLPFNPEATKMLAPVLFWGDYIVGTLVICGEDRGGNRRDVPEEIAKAIMGRYAAMRFPGQVLGADGIGVAVTDMDGNPLDELAPPDPRRSAYHNPPRKA